VTFWTFADAHPTHATIVLVVGMFCVLTVVHAALTRKGPPK
jgi:hypothetical protein